MPFNILNDLAVSNVPEGIALTSGASPTELRFIQVEAAPNLDASGGAWSIVTTADAAGNDVTSLIYTSADGTSTTAPFEIPDGLILAQDTPVVFGDALDTFVALAVEFTPGDYETVLSEFSLIELQIDDAGVPSVAGAQPLITGFRFHFQALEAGIYPLGDGRLGYSTGDNASDFGATFGVVDSVDGAPVALGLGGGIFVEGAIIALDGGGALVVNTSEGSQSGEFQLKQFSSTGDLISIEAFDLSQLLDDSAIAIETPAVTLVVNDAGELDLFVTEMSDPDADVFQMTLDLVEDFGDVDPVEADPTEGDDIIVLGNGNDVVDALGVDDSVFGKGGVDWIIGGDGDDFIDGGVGDDSRTGTETIPGVSSTGIGGLYGGAGDDTVYGRDGVDFIEGGQGRDDLRGGAAARRRRELVCLWRRRQ